KPAPTRSGDPARPAHLPPPVEPERGKPPPSSDWALGNTLMNGPGGRYEEPKGVEGLPWQPNQGDILADVNYNLDQAARHGHHVRAGNMVPAYGPDGRSTGLEALGHAGKYTSAMLHMVAGGLGIIGGPIGIAAMAGDALFYLIEGDPTSALIAGLGAVGRLNPCRYGVVVQSLIRTANAIGGVFDAANAIVAWQNGDPNAF